MSSNSAIHELQAKYGHLCMCGCDHWQHRSTRSRTEPRLRSDARAHAEEFCVCNHRATHDAQVMERAPTPLPAAAVPASMLSAPLVSVLVPTSSARHWAHENLYRCFDAQTWPNKELIILDTGAEPSPVFGCLSDARVRYTHIALPATLSSLVQDLRSFVKAALVASERERGTCNVQLCHV